jgi:hypothetical protein
VEDSSGLGSRRLCGFVTLSGIPGDIDAGMPKVGTTSHL